MTGAVPQLWLSGPLQRVRRDEEVPPAEGYRALQEQQAAIEGPMVVVQTAMGPGTSSLVPPDIAPEALVRAV